MDRDVLSGGDWRAGEGARFVTIDPATNEEAWVGAEASVAQVDHAMGSARAAFPAWARMPLERRIEIARAFAKGIEAKADTIARTISIEMGKPLWDSRGEVQSVIGKIELSVRAQELRAGIRTEPAAFGAMALRHNPHGVMGVLGPFNFPAHLPNGHIVPALLAGNTIVFKPSELAPGAGRMMAEAWCEAGLPDGVLNLVQGGREIGAALLAHQNLNGVLFTGSAAAGTAIHRQFAGRPDVLLALEMGGNNPLIVWPPTDAAASANVIAHSAFLTSGQRCSCARRLILPRGAFGDEIIERLVALAASLRVGAWDSAPEPFMGPLVSVRAAEKARAGERALAGLGAEVIASLKGDGAFVRPSLVDMSGVQNVPDEEIFAPLLQIVRVKTFEEAIARANDTRFGLAAGLISDDAMLWRRAQTELRAGVLNWNRPTTGASGALPFGGPGFSGNLRPSAAYAADYAAYPVAMQTADQVKAIPAPGLPE
jgi:succinylglutamic semialdehyde dehydrogenase